MPEHQKTPRELGFRLPAEWERQQAMWLAWPSPDGGDFTGTYKESVESAYLAMLKTLLPSQDVFLNNGTLAKASGKLERLPPENLQRLHLLDIPSSEWCRDFGPTFLLGPEQQLGAINWKFSKWGGKYEGAMLNDGQATLRMCEELKLPADHIFTSSEITLEGGGIDVNGAGAVLTTESSLLNPNRNPNSSKEDIERQLESFLSIDQVIWLDGTFENDDTDGHIDTLARFVSTDTVVVQSCTSPEDPNSAVAAENIRRLEATKLADGRPIKMILLPAIDRVELEGIRMPASYANFLIANDCVLVPQYGVKQDNEAVAVIGRQFPTRKAVPIDCSGIIWGRGALHCISQQVPLSNR